MNYIFILTDIYPVYIYMIIYEYLVKILSFKMSEEMLRPYRYFFFLMFVPSPSVPHPSPGPSVRTSSESSWPPAARHRATVAHAAGAVLRRAQRGVVSWCPSI